MADAIRPHFSHPHKPTNRSHWGQIARLEISMGGFDGGAIFLLRFDHGFADVILGRITNLANPASTGVFSRVMSD